MCRSTRLFSNNLREDNTCDQTVAKQKTHLQFVSSVIDEGY